MRQLTFTLKMTTALVVKTSVTVNRQQHSYSGLPSPGQSCFTYKMTAGYTNLSQYCYYYNIIIIGKYAPVLEMLLPFTFIARVGFNIINWRLFTFVTATWPSDLLLNCQDAPSCWLRQSTTSIPTLCLVLGRVQLPKPTTCRKKQRKTQWHKISLGLWSSCPKVTSPEVMSSEIRVTSPKIFSQVTWNAEYVARNFILLKNILAPLLHIYCTCSIPLKIKECDTVLIDLTLVSLLINGSSVRYITHLYCLFRLIIPSRITYVTHSFPMFCLLMV